MYYIKSMKFGTKHLSILGIFLFILILWKTNFAATLSSASFVAPFWLWVVLLTVAMEVLIRTSRWQVLASLYAPYPYSKAFQTYMIGIAFGSITPAKIGDVIKILDLKKETGISLKKALGIEVIDRIFDLLFLLLAGLIGIVAGYRLISGAETSLALLGVSILALFAFGIFMLHGSSNFVYRLIHKIIVPVSRHTENRRADFEPFENLQILMESDEAGLCLVHDSKLRHVHMFNHLEYDSQTLNDEYQRDVEKGDDIQLPAHYFPDNNPENTPVNTWRGNAHLLFGNWLNYIYQSTPYDLKLVGSS